DLDVKRFDKPTSWEMLKRQVTYVKNNPTICKTLVIDTIDWAEQLCIKEICSKFDKKGIEDFGCGKGYVYEKEEFAHFLTLLDEVIEKGVNVLLTAHAQLKKFEQPDEMGAYDRWELKLGQKTSSQISPIIKEWADMVFFANYKTFAVSADDKGKKFKAQGGKRVMYTTHHPCWDAKNRSGLPDELPFEYDAIRHIFESQTVPAQQAAVVSSEPETCQTVSHADFDEIIDDYEPPKAEQSGDIPKAVADLMAMDGITAEEVQKVVFARGQFPVDTPIENYGDDFINGWLVLYWKNVVDYVKTNLR
ncbi:MAG: ATP-binding protein, partial [Ruminococcus sp.]|nr:ATP-binding protein [Ruminococcus sp.]